MSYCHVELWSKVETCRKLNEEELLYFNKLIEIEPNNTFALKLRGDTYPKLRGKPYLLSETLGLQPNNYLTLLSRGETYLFSEKYDEALKDFNKSLEKEPDNASTLRLRGLRGETYQKLEREYNEALIDFNNLLEKGPNNIIALRLHVKN
ncbi:hypothetical protein Glove_326g42 [Diversispora epigaea]|uniref:Uncharacterized protein n=1 Tax=Diversispora epigaea TaxID=1348612 RepID=A0A397HMA4_9GLOM|nr:hypothetical protein Glove_326g42 [Diversispora epigaea]